MDVRLVAATRLTLPAVNPFAKRDIRLAEMQSKPKDALAMLSMGAAKLANEGLKPMKGNAFTKSAARLTCAQRNRRSEIGPRVAADGSRERIE